MKSGRGMKALTCVVLAAALAATGAASARAGFVDGVERFNGRTLDTDTWRARGGVGTVTFTQNGALTIDSSGPGDFNKSDYVTRAQTVPIGGSARVDVTVNAARRDQEFNTQTVELALTTGVQQGTDTTFGDTGAFLLIAGYGNGANSRRTHGQLNLGHTGSGGGDVVTGELPLDTPLVFQIERLTPTRARFSVFERADGSAARLLGSTTEDYTFLSGADQLPDDLFISIGTGGTRATFDNITLNQPLPVTPTPIPLPKAAWAGGAGLLLAAACARAPARGMKS